MHRLHKIITTALAVLLLCALSFTAFAHSGRTDSSGGHYNRSTGEYHYHHGKPAHDHYDMDGDGIKDCPYTFKNNSSHNSGNPDISSSNKQQSQNNNSIKNNTGSTNSKASRESHPLFWIILIGLALWLGISRVRKWRNTQGRE